ncbi:MAG: M48 family metalloprotease [Myxococcales bacterium]|nr:M48 family metalloprotease [Myxococcales bacterium]
MEVADDEGPAGQAVEVSEDGRDLVLVDELIVILPPVVGALGTWWIHYPMERRLREALLIRQLDLGRPIYPVLGRGAYVLVQARLHLLLLLVPILIILGLIEIVDLAASGLTEPPGPKWVTEVATLAVAAVVFVFSPLLARFVLALKPLSAGPMRDDLERMCRRHGVRLRQALVWDTYGSMINAAVMGLTGRLRYLLLTDALLETMSRPQVEAVMAHEVGHIRGHHMPWLVVCFLAAMVVAVRVVETSLGLVGATSLELSPASAEWLGLGATGTELVLALVAFGSFRRGSSARLFPGTRCRRHWMTAIKSPPPNRPNEAKRGVDHERNP